MNPFRRKCTPLLLPKADWVRGHWAGVLAVEEEKAPAPPCPGPDPELRSVQRLQPYDVPHDVPAGTTRNPD